MTEPAGTVVLEAVVTAPTVRLAPVIALVAAACVRPATFGVATCGNPDDTTSATALPAAACAPATGVWLITDPAGTVVLDVVVTAPTVSPVFVIAVVAAACVRPATFGTVTGGSVEVRISIAARFQRSAVGAVSLIVATLPVVETGAVRDWTQKVSPTAVSTHWCAIVWPAPGVRAMAAFQSLPTPYTSEPARVVVNDTLGAPVSAPAEAAAPVPPAPRNATTVKD